MAQQQGDNNGDFVRQMEGQGAEIEKPRSPATPIATTAADETKGALPRQITDWASI